MPPLRAVLFDLDDTLTDRALSIERWAPEFIERFGADLDGGTIDEVIHRIHEGNGGGYASREKLGAHLQSSLRWRRPPEAKEIVDLWRDRFPRCNVERAGVTSTLQILHRRGLKIGVVTNGSMSQYTKLDVMGIRPLLSVIIVSDEVGIKKSDAWIFQMALTKLGVLPAEAIFVGDNPVLDVEGSRAVGLRGIWLNFRGEGPNPLCPEVITSIHQVLTLGR